MRLTSIRVQNYRSISDSGTVPVDEHITAFVGKNESGKTAFLRALHLLNPLNPIRGKVSFDAVVDFPAKDYGKYRSRKKGDPEPTVVTATFDVSDDEKDEIENEFGKGFLKSNSVSVSKGYGSDKSYGFQVNESIAARRLLENLQLLGPDKEKAKKVETVEQLQLLLEAIDEPHSSVSELLARIESWRGQRLSLYVIDNYLASWEPKFFYFDEYSTMPGRIPVEGLRSKVASSQSLSEGEQAFLAFLRMGGADLDAIAEGTRTEALIRELENASIAVTSEAMSFWSQNEGLQVEIRETQADPNDDDANLRAGLILNLRIKNNNQFGVTSPFDDRSRGFVWFFSFLAYFSNLQDEYSENDVVLLLDEPGLSLHGAAQADFLRFINDRLAASHQVLYTTHSPFLLESDHLERVRTVEDSVGFGTQVSSDVFRSQPGTALPILTKMGVELFQTLMVGPHTLLIEGSSDFLYVRLLSQELHRRGLTPLDERWVLVPVAGVHKLEPFFKLYQANDLNVAVLMDASTNDKGLVSELNKGGNKGRILTVGDVMGRSDADIEDLLGDDFYADIVGKTYNTTIDLSSIKSKNPRIVKRIEQYFSEQAINSGVLSHQAPAEYLRKHKELLEQLGDEAVAHFQDLIARLNALIP